MTQLALEAGWTRPVALRVLDDYGYVGDGASGAHSATCENGEDYLLKGPAYMPGHPLVAANEIVAARLAELLALPILDHTIAQLDEDLFFASSLMPKKSFVPFMTAELLETCVNGDRIYDVAVFDTWICNTDRHSGNLLLREVHRTRDRPAIRTMLLNDHSHSLVPPGGTVEALGPLAESPAQIYLQQLPWLRDTVTDRSRLGAAIRAAEQVSDYHLEYVVRGVPTPLLAEADQKPYIDLLVRRRDLLRRLLTSASNLFPHLGGPAR